MKRIKSMLSVIVLMLLYTACGSGNSKSYDGTGGDYAPRAEMGMQSETNDESIASSSESDLPEGEKFIVRTTLHVETEHFDESVKVIEKMTATLKGYVESVDASYGTTYDRTKIRSVYYTLRIPKGKTSSAVNTIKSEVGVVIREEMNTENVTKRIRDLNRDIDLLKAKEDRLIELSKKTEDIDAMIRIESELASTISTREYNQAQLQNIEHDVQYDYLTVQLQEVREVTVLENDSFVGDLKTAFRESIDGVVVFFQDLVLFVVRGWFGILLLIVIILILVKVFRKMGKKSIQERNTPQQNEKIEIEAEKDIEQKGELKSRYKDKDK